MVRLKSSRSQALWGGVFTKQQHVLHHQQLWKESGVFKAGAHPKPPDILQECEAKLN